MKFRHIVIVGLVLVGALYFWHTYSQHGGLGGFKAGLGLGM